MNECVKKYLASHSPDIQELFVALRVMIYASITHDVEEKLWAKLPSYYVGDTFVRLIPFKDHINIEAQAVIRYKESLAAYKITPKGMLQLYIGQDIPSDLLIQIFKETFNK